MRSVLDRSDRQDVRLHQPRCANASVFGLRGYVEKLSPLVAMHHLDRSCVIVGKFFEITTFPNSGIRARFYAYMSYARVEHK